MQKVNGKTARDVSEMLLEVTGKALMSRNFDAFADAFHLPQTVETDNGAVEVKNRKELEQMFKNVCKNFDQKNVTDIVRVCEAAVFKSETCVEATHVSHFMAGNHRVNDPFPVFSRLQYIDGTWLITASHYAVDCSTAEGRALNRGVGLPIITEPQALPQNDNTSEKRND